MGRKKEGRKEVKGGWNELIKEGWKEVNEGWKEGGKEGRKPREE